jgi:hypothetical protein
VTLMPAAWSSSLVTTLHPIKLNQSSGTKLHSLSSLNGNKETQ